MLVEQQIAERQARGPGAMAKIVERPKEAPYGDYRVQSASGKTYRVALRGPGLFENYWRVPTSPSIPWVRASTSKVF